MRYFTLLDFQYVVLLIFLGLILFLLLYIAFGARISTPDKKEKGGGLEEYPEGIQAGDSPIPPILIFVYVAFFIWALAYLVVVGLRGGAF
jgi:uncharacterized membrane protein